MHDLPTPDQLLAAVARFLRDEAGPALGRHGDTALAYQARVAANMLDTVARQARRATVDAAEECDRLQALLAVPAGDPAAGDLAALNRRLADRIADGTLPADTPALADHLWATTLAKLAVDQLGYDTFQRHQAGPAAA
jgi:hypothetical protein